MKRRFFLLMLAGILISPATGIAQTLVLEAKESSTLTLKRLYIGPATLKNQPVTVLKINPQGSNINLLDVEPFTPSQTNRKGQSTQIETTLRGFVDGRIHVTNTEDKLIIDLYYARFDSSVIVESIDGICVVGKNANSFAGTITFKERSRATLKYGDDRFYTEFQPGFSAHIYGNQITPLNGSMKRITDTLNTYIEYEQGEAIDTLFETLRPLDNKALVYVLRNDDKRDNYNVKCDGSYVASVSNHDGVYFFVDPGEHTLRSFFGEPLKIEVEKGKTYYYNLKALGGGIMKGEFSNRIEPLSDAELREYNLPSFH